MSALAIAAIAFACVFGAAMLGLSLGHALPENHLSQESKDVVKLGTALIATMSALVLSLLISSAKSAFDKMDGELVQNAARIISLDRALADYGPETKEVRDLVKRAYAARIAMLFPGEEPPAGAEDIAETVVRTETLPAKLWELSPQNVRPALVAVAGSGDRQRDVVDPVATAPTKRRIDPHDAFGGAGVLARHHLRHVRLVAPRNGTVVAALFVCALSASGAILLILEMNAPFTGLMKISSAPMRDALAELGR